MEGSAETKVDKGGRVDKDEWYFNIGYVELLYGAVVIGILVALHFFSRLNRASDLSSNTIEEKSLLLGLVGLVIVLFLVDRVLVDLWTAEVP
jgi:hypothetical protein